MKRMLFGRAGTGVVLALLVLQLIVFWVTLGPLDKMSVFCTGPNGSSMAMMFGVVHLALLVLLGLGAFAVRFHTLRLAYAVLLLVCLSALPIQGHLVSSGALQCDGP